VSGGTPLKHELTVEELVRADSEACKNAELAEKVGDLTVCSRRKSLWADDFLEPGELDVC
jgi:hypothetical protein